MATNQSPGKLSVIVPCFNEESVINETYARLKNSLKEIRNPHELIFINDGSTDGTLDKLKSIASNDRSVIIINFSRNFGHQPAVSSGLHHCTGDYAVIIDADLQDPPSLIPQMLELIEKEKCNVVYGVRKARKGETFFKKLTAKLFYRVMNLMSELDIPVDTGDFRLIDRKVINSFKSLRERHKYIRGLITWIGFKQVPIYYDRDPRFSGETKYPFFKMLHFAIFGMLYFTKKPLKLTVAMGFASIFMAFLIMVYIFVSLVYYPEHVVSGWASILSVITFFGGVQLVTIGLLGEYIGNIFDEVKDRPEYIVDCVMKHE